MKPAVAIILGSGLGDFADALADQTVIDTGMIPHYPKSTVQGHRGKIVFGKLKRVPLCVVQGRVHLYETGNLEAILYPIRILHGLSIDTLLVTNAAGGINQNFSPGDLMMISDQINLTFERPLATMSPTIQDGQIPELYDVGLQKIIRQAASTQAIRLHQGVYCGLRGPSYETAAEVEMARRIGADAVGMSTVNEVSFARHSGMRVAGISCITNLSTGISPVKLSHDEVTEVANKVKDDFSGLLEEIVLALR